MQNWTADFAAPIQAKRDIVFYDQRGTGCSQPSLFCPEVREDFLARLGENLRAADDIARDRTARNACRDRLRARGIDFAGYNSAASALDTRDLRVALGYDGWDLYGVSCGTRLALIVMRDAPQGARSVVLDSTAPPDADIPAEPAANFAHVLDPDVPRLHRAAGVRRRLPGPARGRVGPRVEAERRARNGAAG
jgi:pimeloyl-ACP methyl ester carboxylesterase